MAESPSLPPQSSDVDGRRTSLDERQTRCEAAQRIHAQAQHYAAKLRAHGWTKQDFARALRELLDADPSDPT